MHFRKTTWFSLLIALCVAHDVAAGNVTVAWDPPSDPTTTGHILWYGIQSGDYAHQVDTGLQSSYTVIGLPDGTAYYFAVTAYNAAGESSSPSREVVAVVGLGAPRNLSAAVSGAFVQLQWQAPPQGGGFDYLVEVGSLPGQSDLAILPVRAGTSFSAAAVPDGVYYVRVKAIVTGIAGPASNETTVIVRNAPCTGSPGAPHSLAARVNGAQVDIAWQPGPGDPASGYLLEVGSAPGLSDIAVIGVPGTSFSALAPNGRYFVRARAMNVCGVSAPSAGVSVTVNNSHDPAVPNIATVTHNFAPQERAAVVDAQLRTSGTIRTRASAVRSPFRTTHSECSGMCSGLTGLDIPTLIQSPPRVRAAEALQARPPFNAAAYPTRPRAMILTARRRFVRGARLSFRPALKLHTQFSSVSLRLPVVDLLSAMVHQTLYVNPPGSVATQSDPSRADEGGYCRPIFRCADCRTWLLVP